LCLAFLHDHACPCTPPAAKRSTDTYSASSSATSSSDELVVLDPMGYYSMLGLTPSSQVSLETASNAL
jgi:hypothetical protein